MNRRALLAVDPGNADAKRMLRRLEKDDVKSASSELEKALEKAVAEEIQRHQEHEDALTQQVHRAV